MFICINLSDNHISLLLTQLLAYPIPDRSQGISVVPVWKKTGREYRLSVLRSLRLPGACSFWVSSMCGEEKCMWTNNGASWCEQRHKMYTVEGWTIGSSLVFNHKCDSSQRRGSEGVKDSWLCLRSFMLAQMGGGDEIRGL